VSSTIRQVFSTALIIMLAVFAWRVWSGAWTAVNWGMLAISAVCCLLVFRRFLHIFTYSYGLCAVLNAALIYFSRPSPAAALVAVAAALFGLRLFLFFWQRDRSASYAPMLARIIEDDNKMPVALKGVFWFMVSWLMTFHLMAVYFVAERGELSAGVVAGSLVLLAGVALEGIADAQKQRVKERDPDHFVTAGLYARWRHPNYAGEFLVQAGLIIAGLSAVSSWSAALAVVPAPLYIAILMVHEAGRVDAEQLQRYGDDPEFRAYLDRSGSIVPR